MDQVDQLPFTNEKKKKPVKFLFVQLSVDCCPSVLRQTDRQTERQTDRQTVIQSDGSLRTQTDFQLFGNPSVFAGYVRWPVNSLICLSSCQ